MCLYVISKKTCHAREKARKTPAIDGGREHGPVREYGSSACAQTTSVTTHDGGDLGEGAGPGDRPIGTDARAFRCRFPQQVQQFRNITRVAFQTYIKR